MPSVHTAGSGKEKKSKLACFVKNILSTGSASNKNGDKEDLSRVRSFSPEAITLSPSCFCNPEVARGILGHNEVE